MLRSSLILLLAALLTPSVAPAQSSDTRRANERRGSIETGAAEAEVFFGALRAISDFHLQEFSDSVLWQKALDGLIESLEDPYAEVFTPTEYDEFQEETTGNYAGIGVQITQLNDAVTITAVFRGTPAERAGLLVGDHIVEVDGDDAREWSTEDASQRIRGEVGTTVRVSVAREGYDDPIAFPIERDEVHISAVRQDELPGGVGYISLDRVARGSAQEVDSALQELASTRGLVLDLRRNPGGYLDESLFMADLLLQRGQKLASTRSRQRRGAGTREESWDARTPARFPDKPIVILVDRYTASAAEIVAGALQDHDRALVMGERTFGKGVVQTLMPLPQGRQIRLTTGSWYTPLGRSLHRQRDNEGRPLAEDADTFPVVTTAAGRTIQGGGGIFPDLDVASDTLKEAERELLAAANRAEVPLTLRIEEFAFEEARKVQGSGARELDPAAFDAFVEDLKAEGVSAEILDDPVARRYLDWQTRISFAERSDQFALAMTYRMERDPVLTEAVRLLTEVRTQPDLFAAARERREEGAEVSSAEVPLP